MAAPTGAALGERMARLLADTMTKHQAASLPGLTSAKAQLFGVLAEQLEQATALELRGLLGELVDQAELPPELAGFMRSVLQPQHQDRVLLTIAALIGASFVVTQSAAVAYGRAFEQAANRYSPNAVLSAEQAAVAFVKGVWDSGRGAAEARANGVDGGRFTTLANISGNPPGPAELMAMVRRGVISRAQFGRGIAQGLTRTEWTDELFALRYSPPDPATAVQGVVQNAHSAAAGRRLAAEAGLDPEHFDLAVRVAGSPPGIEQMIELWRRGDASRADVVQAIRESRVKTKYVDLLLRMRRRLIPADTVASMAGVGVLSGARAVDYLQDHGLTAEDARLWVRRAQLQHTESSRDLAKGEVLALYQGRHLGRRKAADLLGDLGYSAAEADMLLDLADTARLRRFLEAAIGRVHTLYVGHRIERPEAATALDRLQVPTDQRTDLLAVWDLERAANVRDLTQAQIVAAYRREVFTRAVAERRLRGIGYEPADARLLLDLATPAEG